MGQVLPQGSHNWFEVDKHILYITKCVVFQKVMVGKGNGTPLQYFCLENPMDGGAWWAAVHGVAQSQT